MYYQVLKYPKQYREEYLKECFIVSIVLHYYLDTNFQFLFNYCHYYLSKIIFTECLFSHRNFKFKAKFTKPNKSLPSELVVDGTLRYFHH